MEPTIRAALNGVIEITVPDVTQAMTAYTKIVVYQDTSATGAFGTETGTATLVAARTGYSVYDADGTSSLYYKAKLSDGDGSVVSSLSSARQYGTSAAYCSAFDVRQEMSIGSGEASTGPEHDYNLWNMAQEASRLIDAYKNVPEESYLASGSVIRYFDGPGDAWLWLDDSPAVSISLVEVEETDGTWTSWAATDWRAWPYNETPIRRVDVSHRTASNTSAWTSGEYRVRLTGVWGVTEDVPELVARACKIQVARWFKKAMQGWSDEGGAAPFGLLRYPRQLERDVRELLDLAEPRRSIL